MSRLAEVTEVPEEFVPYNEQLASVNPGDNVLYKVDNVYSLLKYERHDTSIENHDVHRYSRHASFVTSDWLLADTNEKRQRLTEQQQKERRRYKSNIYGTHGLEFKQDQEFDLYLPSSEKSDLFLTVARENNEGEATQTEHIIEVTTNPDEIVSELQRITRPLYFETVITPFLRGRSTSLKIPSWNSRWYHRVNRRTLLSRFEKKTRHLKHGDFVYVGCKEEVYLLGLARDENDMPYMQGTYTTSIKPMFYFSHNYLNFISRHDAEKPKFSGEGACNVAKYRTYDVPEFGDQPFVFPQMGRRQNCKNTIFNSEPQLITGNVDEAMDHFATTDFAEFADVVRRYAEQVHIVHLSFGAPNGKYYY